MLVRRASKSDGKLLASLIYASAPDLLSKVFEFGDNHSALAFLQYSLTFQNGQYGYENHWIIEIDHQPVACICGWSNQLPESFHRATLDSIVSFYSAVDALKVIQRSHTLKDCIPKPLDDEWCIGHVSVAIDHQRAGLATTLLAKMHEKAQAAKKSYLSLDVDSANKHAISFYLKCGFEQKSASIVSPDMEALGITQHLHMVKSLSTCCG